MTEAERAAALQKVERRYSSGEATMTELLEAKRQYAASAPRAGTGAGAGRLSRESIAKMSKADQRKLATERWDETAAALSGARPTGQPLTPAELADLKGTLRKSPELAADPERWAEIQAEMSRRAATTQGGSK